MNRVEVFQQDAVTYMQTIADESVDVIITDPPYWTLDKWRKIGTTTRLGGHRKEGERREDMWFPTIDQDYLWQWFLEADRVLKLDGHLYVFCDDQVAPILMNWIREAQGDHRFGECHMLIWDKMTNGMGYHYRRRYECIIFAWREPRDGVRGFTKRRLRDLGKPDVFQYKRVTGAYPTEKPAPLVAELATQSARVGDTLLDPFAGSGVLASALPHAYKANVLLNDISDTAQNTMKERLTGIIPELSDRVTFHSGGVAANLARR